MDKKLHLSNSSFSNGFLKYIPISKFNTNQSMNQTHQIQAFEQTSQNNSSNSIHENLFKSDLNPTQLFNAKEISILYLIENKLDKLINTVKLLTKEMKILSKSLANLRRKDFPKKTSSKKKKRLKTKKKKDLIIYKENIKLLKPDFMESLDDIIMNIYRLKMNRYAKILEKNRASNPHTNVVLSQIIPKPNQRKQSNEVLSKDTIKVSLCIQQNNSKVSNEDIPNELDKSNESSNDAILARLQTKDNDSKKNNQNDQKLNIKTPNFCPNDMTDHDCDLPFKNSNELTEKESSLDFGSSREEINPFLAKLGLRDLNKKDLHGNSKDYYEDLYGNPLYTAGWSDNDDEDY